MHRNQKRVFKGWRIALSRDFPELLSRRHDETGSPIPPEKLHMRTISPSSVGFKESEIKSQMPKSILKLPKD